MTTTTTDRRVGISEAERITGIERTTIWRKLKAGKFPAPVYVGERRTWLESELLAWVAEQAARSPDARRGAANLRDPDAAPAGDPA